MLILTMYLAPQHGTKLARIPLNKENSLEILSPDEVILKNLDGTDMSSRKGTPPKGASRSRRAPPVSKLDTSISSGARPVTPSRKVTLPVVKRKGEKDQATDSRQPESANRTRPGSSRQATRPAPTDAKSRDRSQQAGSPISPAGGSTAATADDRPTSYRNGRVESEPPEDGDKTVQEHPVHPAPTELFMEFLTAVMNSEYVTAQKLCTLILIYEPNQPEALSFQKLITEKIILEEEMAAMETDSEDDSEDDDEDSDEDSSQPLARLSVAGSTKAEDRETEEEEDPATTGGTSGQAEAEVEDDDIEDIDGDAADESQDSSDDSDDDDVSNDDSDEAQNGAHK